MRQLLSQSALFGIGAATILLGFYFSVLTFLSGWEFAKIQFFTYWYFIIGLAAGFGIQIGLYSYLKSHSDKNGRVVAVSGTTSTLAMISCCSHYLVNLLPILGIAGFITLISQYQVQLFWVGLLANLLGIIYMVSRIIRVRQLLKA